jgi:hypothetical protein
MQSNPAQHPRALHPHPPFQGSDFVWGNALMSPVAPYPASDSASAAANVTYAPTPHFFSGVPDLLVTCHLRLTYLSRAICASLRATLQCSRSHQFQAVSLRRRAVQRHVHARAVSFDAAIACVSTNKLLALSRFRYVTGNNSDTLPLQPGVPFTSVSGSGFGNEPSTFGVLFGVFGFDKEALGGASVACLVHNQRTNFPALFTLALASGFSVAEFSEKTRTEVTCPRCHSKASPFTQLPPGAVQHH